jgi:hypothetical protein
MNEEINDTIKKIKLSVIQANTDIEAKNPEAVKEFITEFIPLLKRFRNQMVNSKYEDVEHYLNFKDEISNVYDELFIEGRLIKSIDNSRIEVLNSLRKLAIGPPENKKIADILMKLDRGKLRLADISDLIKEIPDNTIIPMPEMPEVLSGLEALRLNENPLKEIPDHRGLIKKRPGISYYNEFVSTYRESKKEIKRPIKSDSKNYSLKQIAIAYFIMGITITKENGDAILRKHSIFKSGTATFIRTVS